MEDTVKSILQRIRSKTTHIVWVQYEIYDLDNLGSIEHVFKLNYPNKSTLFHKEDGSICPQSCAYNQAFTVLKNIISGPNFPPHGNGDKTFEKFLSKDTYNLFISELDKVINSL